MARLLLFRHAKSSWGDPTLDDFDRPLAPRGRRAAKRMGTVLREHGLVADAILCSSAVRARQTLELLLPELKAAPKTAFVDELYHPPGGDYLATIAAQGGAAGTLMVVGHNPAMQETALRLIEEGDPELAAIAARFPTAAVVAIEFALTRWSGIAPRSGRVAAFLRPRGI